MEITDFAKGQLWSILPDKFEVLYRKFFEMQAEEFKKKMQIGDRGGDERPYRVTDGLAVIPITGPLTKRQSIFSFLFGGSSYAKIAQDFRMAVEDEEVGAILLDIDSPGGTVSGAEGLADLVYSARGVKPVVSFANGAMASAAYWIGSAAEAVMAESTATVGSIGVLMIHTDMSEMEKKAGVKTTYLTAGSYKALGNSSEPLSENAKEYFQSELDYIYSIFVETVARNREAEVDQVLTDMADGRTFIGQQAKDAGMVDAIGGYDEALALAGSMINSNTTEMGGFIMQKPKENEISTLEQLTAAFPSLVMEAQDGAVEAQRDKIRQEGVSDERERIIELVNIQFGEEQAKNLKTVIEEGVTPAQLQAIKAMNPEPEAKAEDDDDEDRKKMLDAIHDAGADNPGPDNEKQAKDFMVMVEEYQALHKCKLIKAMSAVSRMHPEAHEAYIRRANS